MVNGGYDDYLTSTGTTMTICKKLHDVEAQPDPIKQKLSFKRKRNLRGLSTRFENPNSWHFNLMDGDLFQQDHRLKVSRVEGKSGAL